MFYLRRKCVLGMGDVSCLQCGKEARHRQQAVSCNACSRWPHRMCNTGKTLILCYLYFTI